MPHDAETHQLPAHRAAGSLRPVSDVLQSLLSKAGYRAPATSPEKEALATAALAVLAKSYAPRRADADEPAEELQLRREAFVAVLCEYPDECIRHVTDPRTGIQSAKYLTWERDGRGMREVRGKFVAFPPNVGDLQQACEQYMGPIRRKAEWEAGRERQQEEQRKAERVAATWEGHPSPAQRLAQMRREASEPIPGIEALAMRIARGIEHAASAERVRLDLEARRQRREDAA